MPDWRERKAASDRDTAVLASTVIGVVMLLAGLVWMVWLYRRMAAKMER